MAAKTTNKRQTRNIRRDEVGGVFRIIYGVHSGFGPEGCDCDDCYSSKGRDHIYRAKRFEGHPDGADPEDYTGDLILSPKQDLVLRFGEEKFQRVPPHEVAHIQQAANLLKDQEGPQEPTPSFNPTTGNKVNEPNPQKKK